jgi:hypothetical protein
MPQHTVARVDTGDARERSSLQVLWITLAIRHGSLQKRSSG